MKRKINSFRGIRAILAISIFLNHCIFFKNSPTGELIFERIFHNGGFAVSVFFILSGFCIHINYADRYGKDYEGNKIKNYISFMGKRIKKIYPIYIFSMFWAMIYNILNKQDILENILHFLLSMTMIQTMVFEYWNILNSAAWFISCIICIYGVYPLVVSWINKCKKKSILVFFMVGGYIMIILWEVICDDMASKGIILPNTALLLSYVFPVYRLLYFFEGVLLAQVCSCQSTSFRNRAGNSVAEVLILVLMGISYYISINGSNLWVNYSNIYCVPIMVIFIYIFSMDKGKISKGLGRGVIAAFGDISMDFYMIHWVIIYAGGYRMLVFLEKYGLRGQVLICFILFGVTVILSIMINKICNHLFMRVQR